MRKNTLTAIMGALALIGTMPAARAEIASREYVDNQVATKMDAVTIDEEVTAESTNLVTSGAVYDGLSKALAIGEHTPNMILATDSDGDVVGTDKIELGKIKMPDAPQRVCANGCMLMVYYRDNRMVYAWEPIARENNENDYQGLNYTPSVSQVTEPYIIMGSAVDEGDSQVVTGQG